MDKFDVVQKYYEKSEYIDTASGNKISSKAFAFASQNIIFHGKSILHESSIIRGDLSNVRIGRWCIISKDTVLRPPFKKFNKGLAFFPLQIGEYNYIGENTIVQAASIGSYVYIGKNVVLGKRCILKDCCFIEDNTVVPPDAVIQSCTRYSGSPATVVDSAPECMQDLMMDFCKSYYSHFQLKPAEQRAT